MGKGIMDRVGWWASIEWKTRVYLDGVRRVLVHDVNYLAGRDKNLV
jgi:hypothetical protein